MAWSKEAKKRRLKWPLIFRLKLKNFICISWIQKIRSLSGPPAIRGEPDGSGCFVSFSLVVADTGSQACDTGIGPFAASS